MTEAVDFLALQVCLAGGGAESLPVPGPLNFNVVQDAVQQFVRATPWLSTEVQFILRYADEAGDKCVLTSVTFPDWLALAKDEGLYAVELDFVAPGDGSLSPGSGAWSEAGADVDPAAELPFPAAPVRGGERAPKRPKLGDSPARIVDWFRAHPEEGRQWLHKGLLTAASLAPMLAGAARPGPCSSSASPQAEQDRATIAAIVQTPLVAMAKPQLENVAFDELPIILALVAALAEDRGASEALSGAVSGAAQGTGALLDAVAAVFVFVSQGSDPGERAAAVCGCVLEALGM